MKKITVLATGILCAASMAMGASASGIIEQIKAELRPDFEIIYDGNVQNFKNVNGETVYPILYEGSTYLPIRAVSNLFDKEITWYEADKRIEISEPVDTLVTDTDNNVPKSSDTKENDTNKTETKKSDTNKSNTKSSSSSSSGKKTNTTNTTTHSDEKVKEAKADIGIAKAKETAVEAIGLDIEDVTITKAFMNENDLYQINISHGAIDYEVEIDPETGKHKTIYKDGKDEDNDGKKDIILTSAEAKEIVYEKAGVDSSEVDILDIEVHLDSSTGIFTVELDHDGKLYTAQISRSSGAILEWEITEE